MSHKKKNSLSINKLKKYPIRKKAYILQVKLTINANYYKKFIILY